MKYAIWLLLILLIFFRYFTTRPVYKNGDRVRVSGTVYSDPLFFGKNEYLKIAGLRIFVPAKSDVEYGDKVAVEGVVDGGQLKNAKIIKKEDGNFLAGFRNKIVDFYQKVLPQPESGAMSGIVFGARGAMTPEFYNQTKVSGLFHLVIPSGLKTTLVISFLISLFTLFFKRKIAIPFVILGIILYLFVTGFDAPIVRASIMAGAYFLAQITGRIVSSWRVFFLTAFLMLAISPDWVEDVGFWVSFSSVAFLILYKEDLNKLIKLPKFVRENVSASLAAQVGAAPILYLAFNQFSFMSPIANTLVLWLVPFLMAGGLIAGTLGLVFPGIGKIILLIILPPLWFFTKVAQVFGS